MNDDDVKQYWEQNAEAWTALSRAGYDVYRDLVNTPGFLKLLPDVRGLKGLDLGCGEGHNTRLVAQRGAVMTGIDLSETFIRQAQAKEVEQPIGIRYSLGSGLRIEYADESFDFCLATMSIMDMPDPVRAIAEAYRVVKRGGFFQFSMTHPCFGTPKWQWQRDEKGEKTALLCGDYFVRQTGNIDQWAFGAAPPEARGQCPPFRTPRFSMTLSEWLNAITRSGFVLEEFHEPCPDEATAKAHPGVADARIVAYFLIIRCKKP
ncbi:MAG: class I SAM-dependent methyltransferase [Candidatus Edwardsbacteria bacterium]|nr:class I SAM-dependent methyltransferase [Candidatus Edwardsbacteria bacterium]